MELRELTKALKRKRNGSFFTVTYKGNLNVSAASKKKNIVAFKITRMQVRKGIKYSNLKSVQDKVLFEGKELTHELPWGQWKKGYKDIVEHNGEDYIMLYPNPNASATTRYFVIQDGVETEMTYEELKASGVMTPGFFNKNSGAYPDAMTINVKNILAV